MVGGQMRRIWLEGIGGGWEGRGGGYGWRIEEEDMVGG